MPDPLDALRLPLTPLAPRRRFAEDLRRRLEAELRGPDPEGATMPTETPVVHATMTPYLIVEGAADALDWYAANLGARETYRLEMPDGRIGHATMQIRAEGKVWDITLAPPPRTKRAGLEEGTIPVGATVTVSGHRNSNPERFEIKTERVTYNGKTYNVYPDRE